MQTTDKLLTNQEMIEYYMHRVDTGENNREKKMNRIFYKKNYKKSKKYYLNMEYDSSFCITPSNSTPIVNNKNTPPMSCLFCIPLQWPKIFDVNDK